MPVSEGLVTSHQIPSLAYRRLTGGSSLAPPTFCVSAKCAAEARETPGECLQKLPGESTRCGWRWWDSQGHDSTMQHLEPTSSPQQELGNQASSSFPGLRATHTSLLPGAGFTFCVHRMPGLGTEMGAKEGVELTQCPGTGSANWLNEKACFFFPLNFISPLCLSVSCPYSTHLFS